MTAYEFEMTLLIKSEQGDYKSINFNGECKGKGKAVPVPGREDP
jgi:hypothetical protein